MKFLIATTLMCLALVGHSQSGSLRGLIVPVPHRVYGVPVFDNEIEETQPFIEDRDRVSIDSESHEKPIVPIVSQPSIEYGAPGEANGIETVQFVDSLPLVDSHVSFGTPSEKYGPPAEMYGPPAKPTTPKSELPYLQPGLPTLPAAPVIPVVPEVSEEHAKVSNEYLPPIGGTPLFVEEYVPSIDETPLVVSEGKPSEVYGPPATVEVELPTIHEIPALPEAPATVAPAAVTVEHSGQYFYQPPVIGFPTSISYIPELPVQPATPFIVAKAIPSEHPAETYGPPAKPTTPKAELPYLQPGLPTLPAAPLIPVVPEVSEEHAKVSNEYLPPIGGTPSFVEECVPSIIDEAPLVVSEGKPSEVYGPPATVEVELPTIHEIPALPEAPTTVAPATVTIEHSGKYFYQPPAIGFPTPISHIPELPLEPATPFIVAEAIPSKVYGPPAHEEHKPSELYGAAKPVHIPELPAAPITTFAAENAKPSEGYTLPAPSLPVKDVKTVPVHATGQYSYEPPAVAFPTPVSVEPIIPEIKKFPVEAPRHYLYDVPAKAFPTPVTLPVGHGIISHSGFVQNAAITSSSSSSLQVNKYAVPLTIQPHADAVVIEELKPIGPAFSVHSVGGNSENTSKGSYNQVSVVKHLLPQLSSFDTIVGHHQPLAYSGPVAVPHGAYAN